MRDEACLSHQRGVQSGELLDLRMACLDRARGRMEALTRALSRADGEVVEKAVQATLELLDASRDPQPDSETLALEHERQQGIASRIRAALARLPKSQREVVTLHKIEGKTMAEISETLGVREGTLRVRAHRGYKNLATMLGSYRTQAAAA